MTRLLSDYQSILTVSDLNRKAKKLLACHFSRIEVTGELSNLTTPASGHLYFSLKDNKAQVRCALFKSQLKQLDFVPENGQLVIVSAQVSLYEGRGDYQLIVDKIRPAGEGILQLAVEQLKTKLLAEGLFDQRCKQTLPLIPKQIGIVTSPTGAAVYDILTVLKRRFPLIPVMIYPTSVQGKIAKDEICQAIEVANQQCLVDLIILARGGGSLEDLWAFNEESVARSIAKSHIPIISAIGHEVDFTIADFVADYRAPTPSAAAEQASPHQQDWLRQFQSIESRLIQRMYDHLKQSNQTIQWFTKRLQQQHPEQQFQAYYQTLEQLKARLLKATHAKIKQANNRLVTAQHLLLAHNPSTLIGHKQQQQQFLSHRLNRAIQLKLKRLSGKLLTRSQTLHTVSPLATLERGYAIVMPIDSSAIIDSVARLKTGDQLKIRLNHGHIISQVKAIDYE